MRAVPLPLRIDRWARRKFTPAGGLILAFATLAAAFGVNTREAQVYQIFGLLLALLVLAALASMRGHQRVRIERRLPECVSAGSAFSYSLSLTNLDGKPCTGLWLQESAHAEVSSSSLARRKLPRLDAVLAPPLLPGETVALTVECHPRRRGEIHFGGTWSGLAEPLGLLRATRYQAHPGKVLVLPRRYPVRLPILAGLRRLQPRGEAFASHVGDAEEFSGVRDFRPGDSPRRLHWKAWARSGNLVVKEYQEEYFVRQALVLDNFSADDARFEAAVSVAASLVTADRPQDSLLDLMFVERQAYTLTQGRGVSGEDDLLRVLAVVALAAEGDFSILAQAVEARAARLSGVICILLAWDAPRQALVAGLRAMGVPVHVWVVDDGEVPLEPGPLGDMPQHLARLRPGHLEQDLARA